jgi:hypothetical protein
MVTITTDEKCQIKGLCTDCVFVAAKCAEDDVKECPYFAVESAMCEANSLLAEVRAIYDELLEELMYLYQHCPNNFRKPPKEYFIKEKEMQKKLSELFA